MSRISVCVLYCGVMYEWWMWCEQGWRRNLKSVLVYPYWNTEGKKKKKKKKSTGSSSVRSSSNGWITMNTTYAYMTKECWKLGLNQVHFGTETSNWGSAPPTLLIPVLRRNFCHGLKPDCCMQDSDSASVPQRGLHYENTKC